ncbi:MAG: MFS transporter [Bdellovibrionales bacterium]
MFKLRNLSRLSMAQSINTVGTALTFTGLPVFLAQVTGNVRNSSLLFMLEALAGIVMSLIGGHLVDRVSKKNVAMVCNILSGILILFLFFSFDIKHTEVIYAVGMLTSLVNAMAAVATNSWFRIEAKKSDLRVEIGRRGLWLSGAKILGMSLGPITFSYWHQFALLADGLSYFSAAGILFYVNCQAVTGSAEPQSRLGIGSLVTSLLKKNIPFLISASLLSGLMSVPFINLSIVVLQNRFHVDASWVSMLWLLGSGTSILSNLCIARGLTKYFSSRSLTLAVSFLLGFGILMMSFAIHPLMFVIAYATFPIANSIIGNLITSNLASRMPSAEMGRLTALEYTLIDLASLFGIAIGALAANSARPLYLLLFIPIVIWRARVAIKMEAAPACAA